MQFAWAGLYLIETGVPVSWSNFDYPKYSEFYKGKISYEGHSPEANVILYKPWLEEPPLFSLIVGYFAHKYQADRNQFVPSSYIRIPMLYIAAGTSVMIFLVTRMVSGYWPGMLAMLLYGTIPIFVFSSRIAMAENLISLIYITLIYLFIKYIKTPKFIYVLPMPLLIGLAGLSKPTGFLILPLAIFAILINNFKGFKQIFNKKIFYLILLKLPFIFLYFAYGYYFDTLIFNKILDTNLHRPVGFSSLTWFFISPSFGTTVLKDGWFIFCLLSAAYFIFKPLPKYEKFIVLSFIYSVIIVMVSGGEGDLLAWYRFPSYPILAIMGSWGIIYIIKKADLFATFLSAGLLLASRTLLVDPFRLNISPMNFRIVFSLLMLPSSINYFLENKFLQKISRALIIFIVVSGIYFNMLYVYNAFYIECENRICPLAPPTNYSWLEIPLFSYFLNLAPLK